MRDTGGANSIVAVSTHNSITTGGGTDYIYITNAGTDNIINVGQGNDTVVNAGANATIYAGAGNDSIVNTGANTSIYAEGGNDFIYNNAKAYIDASVGGGSNTIYLGSSATNSTILTGGSGDTVTIGSTGVYLIDGGGNNSIVATGTNEVISLGSAVDYVYSSGGSSSIIAGDGADHITVSGNGNIIFGGAGNDIISLGAHDSANYIRYSNITSAGNGNDTIYGFNETDKLIFDEGLVVDTSVSSVEGAGNDFVITIGDTSITFKDVTISNNGTFKAATTSDKNTDVKTLTYTAAGARVLSDPVTFLNDVFEDENDVYTTDDTNNISDIIDITPDNYSTGNIETIDLDKLAKGGGYVPSATYGTEKKQE